MLEEVGAKWNRKASVEENLGQVEPPRGQKEAQGSPKGAQRDPKMESLREMRGPWVRLIRHMRPGSGRSFAGARSTWSNTAALPLVFAKGRAVF